MMDGSNLDLLARTAMADRRREALLARRAAQAPRDRSRFRAGVANRLAGLALCVDRQAARVRLSDPGKMGRTTGSRAC
jgi:hypothetical protein